MIATSFVDEPFVDALPDTQSSNRPAAKKGKVSLIRADQIETEQIEWLWQDRIPFGAITILAGDPGLGKSLLTIWLAAQLTRGELGGLGPANVVLSSAEDARAQIVVPRLQAAGAVLDRVHFLHSSHGGFETTPVLPGDARDVGEQVREQQARLLVIDPLTAHLGPGINSWKDQEIRQALLPLRALAEEAEAAVVIVAHLNKGQSNNPLHRLGGSIGLPAAARSVLLLGSEPGAVEADRERRVLAQVKSNLGPRATSLAFELENGEVAGAGRIVHTGDSPYTGEDLLALEPHGRETESKRAAAKKLLAELLANGPRPVSELRQEASERDVSPTTLDRAKKDLGIKPGKQSFDGGWVWALPDPRPETQTELPAP